MIRGSKTVIFVIYKNNHYIKHKTFYSWQEKPSLADDYEYVMCGKVGFIFDFIV